MKHQLIAILCVSMFVPTTALAVGGENSVVVGGFDYVYDEVVVADTDKDGTSDRTSYYTAGKLILTAYDENGDGKNDRWFEWKEDKVTLEMSATKGGEPDEFIVVDGNEKALTVETSKGGAGTGGGLMNWIAILAVIGAAAWLYNKKKQLKGSDVA